MFEYRWRASGGFNPDANLSGAASLRPVLLCKQGLRRKLMSMTYHQVGMLLILAGLAGCSPKKEVDAPDQSPQGGLVIHQADGHGLVLTTGDVGFDSWENASRTCDELVSGGYDDWRLPTREELDLAYAYFRRKGFNEIKSDTYWSSTPAGDRRYWVKDFDNGTFRKDEASRERNLFRAVRSF